MTKFLGKKLMEENESTEVVELSEVMDEPSKRNWLSFWSLLIMQTQNAFNDKAVQFLLVCVASFLMVTGDESFLTVGMAHVLAGLVVTPFILLAPLAGWLADRFPKSLIIKISSVFQLIVFLLLLGAVTLENLYFCVVCFFLLAIQSALLSPAKVGVIKELVGRKRLGFASGMMEMLTILGILGGTISMSKWYASLQLAGETPWVAFKLPLYVLLSLTPVAIILAFLVEKTDAQGGQKFKASLLVEHVSQLKNVLLRRELRLSAIAVSYFWSFAGFVQILSVQIAQTASVSKGGAVGVGDDLAKMMLMAGGGIAIGSVIGSLASKNRIELGLVPIGGAMMVIGSFVMAFAESLGSTFMLWMCISGAGAAIFLVPVHAYIQDKCEEEERGNVLAASNLMNCFGGISAVVIQLVFIKLGFSVSTQFCILGGITILVLIYSLRLLPSDLLRFLILLVVRRIYKVKGINIESIPESGGVLLVPNHISYADAFILSAACTRPVRFLIFREFYENRWFQMFLKFFNTVPISSERSKEAINTAVEALNAGDVVCIFPEGQLTRTGSLSEINRGFEMIARRSGAPVLPVYMDGLWGSILSYERKKYFFKLPYWLQIDVRVNFGEVLAPKQATHLVVRKHIENLCHDAIWQRDIFNQMEDLKHASVRVEIGDFTAVEKTRVQYLAMDETAQKLELFHALQIMEGPLLIRNSLIVIELEEIKGLEIQFLFLLPILMKLKLAILSQAASEQKVKFIQESLAPMSWFASAMFYKKNTNCRGDKYTLSGVLDLENQIYSWWVYCSKVVAVQMPEPSIEKESAMFQAGFKEGSKGRVITGFKHQKNDKILIGESVVYKLSEQEIIDKEGYLTEFSRDKTVL